MYKVKSWNSSKFEGNILGIVNLGAFDCRIKYVTEALWLGTEMIYFIFEYS